MKEETKKARIGRPPKSSARVLLSARIDPAAFVILKHVAEREKITLGRAVDMVVLAINNQL